MCGTVSIPIMVAAKLSYPADSVPRMKMTATPKTPTEALQQINACLEAFLVAFPQLDAADQLVALERALPLLAETDAIYLKMREQMALSGVSSGGGAPLDQ